MSASIGYVVRVNPGDQSVDLVLKDGRRMTGVQVSTPNGSTRSGIFDMPAVPEKADPWDITKITGQDQKAIVTFIDGLPVVTGFLTPQINQMTFDDGKMRVDRHQSDVIQTIDGDGNIQLAHPSGTFVRIAESTEFTDLAGKNNDKNLAVDRNTSRRVHVHIELAGKAAIISISPDGAVSVQAKQDVTVETEESATIKTGDNCNIITGSDTDVRVDGNASIKASGWGQFVMDGPGLVKSNTVLKLKGPSGEIIL